MNDKTANGLIGHDTKVDLEQEYPGESAPLNYSKNTTEGTVDINEAYPATLVAGSNQGAWPDSWSLQKGEKAEVTLDIIGLINKWNLDAGNSGAFFNVRQVAMYTGLQCEEMAEKLQACGLYGSAAELDRLGNELKQGVWDTTIANGNRQEMLDADADIAVVTIGSALSQGADFKGAMAEVIRANEAKRFPDGMLHKNESGKIIKPEGWKPPDLTPFVAKS